MHILPVAFAYLLLMLGAGCASAPGVSKADAVAQRMLIVSQLIIKFKPAAQACDAAAIARLAADIRIAIEFVRPMSGDACVVKLSSRDAAAAVDERNRLQRHPAIEGLESDRVMKTP